MVWSSSVSRSASTSVEQRLVWRVQETSWKKRAPHVGWGSIWKAIPSLATQRRSGQKESEECCTVGLCCNANGRVKCRPIVIHEFLKPRCFDIARTKLQDYGSLSRPTLLLMDGFSAHACATNMFDSGMIAPSSVIPLWVSTCKCNVRVSTVW